MDTNSYWTHIHAKRNSLATPATFTEFLIVENSGVVVQWGVRLFIMGSIMKISRLALKEVWKL